MNLLNPITIYLTISIIIVCIFIVFFILNCRKSIHTVNEYEIIEVKKEEFVKYIIQEQLQLFKKTQIIYSHENELAIHSLEDSTYQIRIKSK